MDSLDIISPESGRKVVFKLNTAFPAVFAVVGTDVFFACSVDNVKGGFAAFESDLGSVKDNAAFRNKSRFAFF